MSKTILKVRIKAEETHIWYNKKLFKGREDSIQAIIIHLQRMLDEGIIEDD